MSNLELMAEFEAEAARLRKVLPLLRRRHLVRSLVAECRLSALNEFLARLRQMTSFTPYEWHSSATEDDLPFDLDGSEPSPGV